MPIQELLESRGFTLKKKTPREYSCPCPFCSGVDRFCVWPEKNKSWCRQCGWKGDDIQLIRDLDGLSFREANEALGQEVSVGYAQGKPTKHKSAKKQPALSDPTHVYSYEDEAGKLIFD